MGLNVNTSIAWKGRRDVILQTKSVTHESCWDEVVGTLSANK